jgi:hypothetical protein
MAWWAGLQGAVIRVGDTFAVLLVEGEAKEGWAFKGAALWVMHAIALVSVELGAWWAAHVVAVLLVAHARAGFEVWSVTWSAQDIALRDGLAVAVILAEVGVLGAFNWTAVLVDRLARA